MPKVPVVDGQGNINLDEINNRYFHSVFPSCEGVSDEENDTEKWDYVIHPENLFVLETKSMFEYILYTHREVLSSDNQTKNTELIFNNVSSRQVWQTHSLMFSTDIELQDLCV